MVAYDRVLSTLSEVTSQHAAAGSDSDSDASDGEIDAEAAAAAAKSARAAKKAAKVRVPPVTSCRPQNEIFHH